MNPPAAAQLPVNRSAPPEVYLRLLHARGLGDALSELTRDPVAQTSRSRVPWTSRRRRFEANLRVVDRRFPAVAAEIRRCWPVAEPHCELHRATDGQHYIRAAGPPWPPTWLFGLDDAAAAADRDLVIAPNAMPPSLLFDGVGTGVYLDVAYQRTAKGYLGASSALLVAERDPALLAITLHLNDWQALLNDPRVELFCGERVEEELAALLARRPEWPMPAATVTSRPLVRLPWRGDALPNDVCAALLHREAQRRTETGTALFERLSQRNAERDAAWWAERYRAAMRGTGVSPLRVLCVTSRHTSFLQYSMRDCEAALRTLGCETRLLIEGDAHLQLAPEQSLQLQLDFDPDLILLISRMRYEFPALLHPSVPSCTWDQDNLPWVFDARHRNRFGWNDFLMGIQAAYAPTALGWDSTRCRPCELASCAAVYDPAPVAAALLDPLRCDVSYVSHASTTVEREIIDVREWLPDGPLRIAFDAVLERTLPGWLSGGEFPGPLHSAIFDATTACWGRLPEPKEFEQLFTAAGRIGDRAFRHVALAWIADECDRTGRSLRLYGNGWERHPRLSRYAAGPAANGEPLRRVYQASTVNLQLMGWGFIHQRSLDGLTAGGCFLSRWSQRDDYRSRLRALLETIDRTGVRSGACVAHLSPDERDRIAQELRDLGTDARGLSPEVLAETRKIAGRPSTIDLLPRYSEMAFATREELATRLGRLLDDGELRASLVRDAQQALSERYSYRSRMHEMLAFVADGLAAGINPNPARWVPPARPSLSERAGPPR